MLKIPTVASLLALLVSQVGAAAAVDPEPIQRYLDELQAQSGAPGVSAAIMVRGELVYSGGVGVANLSSGTPQNGTSVHNIGSISKTHAVVAVMQLVEQGKVNLDAPIQTYIPWFPRKDSPITVRELLTHTSGIRHYKDGEFGEHNLLAYRQFDDFEESTRRWRDDPLLFTPGKYWSYSSYAIDLLQGIVESASGEKYESYLRAHVWKPAGMLDTQLDVPTRIVPRRGRGYERNEKTHELENAGEENVSYKYAGGGLISTDEDLVRFGHALDTGVLLKPATSAEMYRLQLRPDIEMAPGTEPVRKPPPHQALVWWMDSDSAGHRFSHHSGGVKGTVSELTNFNDEDIVVALHFNADNDVDLVQSTEVLADLVRGAQVGDLPQRHFDLLIRDGVVVDGSGAPRYHADVGVIGDTIAAVGNLSSASATRVVEAHDKVLTPGFIDLHAHLADSDGGDKGLLSKDPRRRAAQNYVAQGVTTVLSNPDGNQPLPLREQRRLLAEVGIGLNVGLTDGHNSLRARVMGQDLKRPANAAEIRRMQLILLDDLAHQGSFGLSLGTEYFSGRYASTEEQVELGRVLAPYNGIFIPHLRSQGIAPMWYLPSVDGATKPPTLDDAIGEVLRVADETGATVVFTHLKAWGPGFRGQGQKIVERLQAARDRGDRVFADVYPYDSSGSDGDFVAIPPWALGHKKIDPARRADLARDIRHALALKGGPENVVVLSYPRKAYVGKRLSQLMAERKLDEVELVLALQREGDPHLPGGAHMRSFSMSDEDIKTFYRQPWTATSTDGWVVLPEEAVGARKYENTNRRVFGSYPRRIAYYSQEQGVDTLEQAVRSMSGLPAQILNLTDRGRIAVGMKADLVVLDLKRLRDNTTYLEPSVYPDGVDDVLVNGTFVVDEGRRTLALPGKVLAPAGTSSGAGRS